MSATTTSYGAIIPTYNASAFLAEALTSIVSQTLAPSSVLVVDDASTDDTALVAERFASEGYPVRCIKLPTNGGPATARNIGLREMDEPLVAFLDADDVWLPTHCRTLVDLLDSHSGAVLAHGRTAPLDQCEAMTIPTGSRNETQLPVIPTDVLPALIYSSEVPQSAAVARRRNILEVGGYTEGMRHAEDYDLWLRLALMGSFIDAGAVTCLRRRHEAQATRQSARMFRGAWEARHRFASFARSRGKMSDEHEYAAICAAAFERDLTRAWRSRDRGRVRAVLELEPLVPGGHRIARSWRRRLQLVWPVWRVGAWLWDRQPPAVRNVVRRIRDVPRSEHAESTESS